MSQTRRPLHFVVDATVFEIPLTGIAKATLGLYQGCLDVDPDLRVEFLHRLPLHAEIPSPIQTVHRAGFVPSRPTAFWRSVNLPLYAAQNRPQIFHFPWNGGVPAFMPKGVLRVMTLHDVLPLEIPDYLTPLKLRRYKQRIQQNINRAHLVITDSEYSRRRIQSEFSIDHEPVVVYPASPLLAEGNPASSRTGDYFLYCGGYDKRKGIEELAEAFVRLWQDPNFRIPLVMAGTPHHYSSKLASLIADGKTSGAIQERGYVTETELANLYRNAVALVYPSRYEGFGLPPLEAMTLGCPVITHKLTSLPEVCGEAALYLDGGEARAIEKAVREMAGNQELRQRLVELGSQQSRKFSWKQSAKVFLDAAADCHFARNHDNMSHTG